MYVWYEVSDIHHKCMVFYEELMELHDIMLIADTSINNLQCKDIKCCHWTHKIVYSQNISMVTVGKLTPTSSTNILSRPTGPKLLFTMLAMDDAAITERKQLKLD